MKRAKPSRKKISESEFLIKSFFSGKIKFCSESDPKKILSWRIGEKKCFCSSDKKISSKTASTSTSTSTSTVGGKRRAQLRREKRESRLSSKIFFPPPPPLSRNEIFLEMKTTGAVFFACRGRGSFGGWKVANPTTAITTSTNDDGDNDGVRRFLSASGRTWKDVSAYARVRGWERADYCCRRRPALLLLLLPPPKSTVFVRAGVSSVCSYWVSRLLLLLECFAPTHPHLHTHTHTRTLTRTHTHTHAHTHARTESVFTSLPLHENGCSLAIPLFLIGTFLPNLSFGKCEASVGSFSH